MNDGYGAERSLHSYMKPFLALSSLMLDMDLLSTGLFRWDDARRMLYSKLFSPGLSYSFIRMVSYSNSRFWCILYLDNITYSNVVVI
jgi:hypothetical protein